MDPTKIDQKRTARKYFIHIAINKGLVVGRLILNYLISSGDWGDKKLKTFCQTV